MTKDMKTCIKDFLKHVESLEGESDPDGCGFNREYRVIHERQIKNRRDNVFSMEAGKDKCNLNKNRYKDILPYDDHRVKLNTLEGDDVGTDYINASYLMGVKGSGGYIATQGPLAATVNDFWRLIWEKDIEIVFMACRTVEMGKIKCKQYWNDLHCSDEFGDITVFTDKEDAISSDFTKRWFRVTRGETERTVIQFHYYGWPDHGIPDDPAHIRDIIGQMRESRTKVVPILVHCSAGCGRTGTIAAIDYVWSLLEEGKLDENFNLQDLICKFREQRMSIVQTADQYALVYRVLSSLCQDWLSKMATHTYENVELDQVYANIGNIVISPKEKEEEEEHVYEDSMSLAENLKKRKVKENSTKSKSPPLSPTQCKSPPSPRRDTDHSTRSQSMDAGNYVNVKIANGRPQCLGDTSPGVDNDDSPVRHLTVIKIGAAGEAKPPASASGNQNEVLNLVHSNHPPKLVSRAISSPAPCTSQRAHHSLPPKASTLESSDVDPKMVGLKQTGFNFKERLPRVKGPVPKPTDKWKPNSSS